MTTNPDLLGTASCESESSPQKRERFRCIRRLAAASGVAAFQFVIKPKLILLQICMLPFDVRTIFSDHKEISGEEKVERVVRVSGTKILVPFGHLVHVLPYALSKCI